MVPTWASVNVPPDPLGWSGALMSSAVPEAWQDSWDGLLTLALNV